MFLDELQPVIKELIEYPVAFFGGVISGALRLKLSDDPLKRWLEEQGMTNYTESDESSNNGNTPQSINIE